MANDTIKTVDVKDDIEKIIGYKDPGPSSRC